LALFYDLFIWKSPRVRTSAAARAAFVGREKDIGSPEDVAELIAGVGELVGAGSDASPVKGALLVRIPDSELQRIADPLRNLVDELGFVLFDPNSGRLVTPHRPGAAAWHPRGTAAGDVVRESIAGALEGDDDRSVGQAVTTQVLRRTGGNTAEPPMTVWLPFPSPPGFVIPYLVPERLRSPKRLASLAGQLDGRRAATTRRAAATLLGGWQGHGEAMALLRERLVSDPDQLTRALCGLGLAISNEIDPSEVIPIADDSITRGRTEADFDTAGYAFLAGIVACRHRSDDATELRLRSLLALVPDSEADSLRWRSLAALLEARD